MSNRSEIAWTRKLDAEKVDVCARRFGDRWSFFSRPGRGDQWQPIARPTLEDWLQLLDGVRRRIGRGLQPPEEEKRVITLIREQFPDADIP